MSAIGCRHEARRFWAPSAERPDRRQVSVGYGEGSCHHRGEYGAAWRTGVATMWKQYWEDRGSPWEYDPGPSKNRSWSRLFAETPNYRGFGIAMSATRSSAGTSGRCSTAVASATSR